VVAGKETIIKLQTQSKKVSLGNPDVANVTLVSPTEIIVNGKKPGTTSLIVWDAEGKTTFFDVYVTEYKAALKDQPQVVLEVKVAQVDKTKLKELGISYVWKGENIELTAPGLFSFPNGTVDVGRSVTQTVTGAGTGTATSTTSSGIGGFDINNVTPQIGLAYFPGDIAVVLRALAAKGYGKILAEPNLTVRSGEEGKFLAGSRIPVQEVTGVGGQETVSITYEEVGIKLNFKPEVLPTGTIRLKIDPAEVSNIQQILQFQNVIAPVIDTRQVSTSVDLKDGECLILAGLISEEEIKNIQKIPLLGDIPILGALFRSTSEEMREKELAFFITPRIAKAMPPGTKPELPTDKKLTPKEESEFQWIPMPGGNEEKQQ
jgi:pilus assembly protein CpaC